MEPDLDKEEDLQPQPKELTGEHLLTTEYLGVCPHHPLHLTQHIVTLEVILSQHNVIITLAVRLTVRCHFSHEIVCVCVIVYYYYRKAGFVFNILLFILSMGLTFKSDKNEIIHKSFI